MRRLLSTVRSLRRIRCRTVKDRCQSGQLTISEPLTQRFATALSLTRAISERVKWKGAVRSGGRYSLTSYSPRGQGSASRRSSEPRPTWSCHLHYDVSSHMPQRSLGQRPRVLNWASAPRPKPRFGRPGRHRRLRNPVLARKAWTIASGGPPQDSRLAEPRRYGVWTGWYRTQEEACRRR